MSVFSLCCGIHLWPVYMEIIVYDCHTNMTLLNHENNNYMNNKSILKLMNLSFKLLSVMGCLNPHVKALSVGIYLLLYRELSYDKILPRKGWSVPFIWQIHTGISYYCASDVSSHKRMFCSCDKSSNRCWNTTLICSVNAFGLILPVRKLNSHGIERKEEWLCLDSLIRYASRLFSWLSGWRRLQHSFVLLPGSWVLGLPWNY